MRPGAGTPSPLPREVTGALAALVPADGIAGEFTAGGRSGGDSLRYGWVPVTEVRLRLVTGFPVLRLPPRAVAGRREVLAVPGRDGEPSFGADERGRPSVPAFAVFHLPPGVDWRHASTWSVLDADLTCLSAQLPPDDRPWPQAVVSRRSAGGPGDSTVVEVDGTTVAVQSDRCGAVRLGWSIHRPARGPSRRWDVTLLTRGDAVQVVRDVREAGLLT